MDSLTFLPWIGNKYWTHPLNGSRVLVLGESHYNRGGKHSSHIHFTQSCINEVLEGKSKVRFWTNIAVALLGQKPDQKLKSEFWQAISFYNYIQEFVGLGSRVRPADEMWRKSQQPFKEVLLHLKPRLLVVLGYALWKNLPKDIEERALCLTPGIEAKEIMLTVAEPILALRLIHPSSGRFSGKKWNERINVCASGYLGQQWKVGKDDKGNLGATAA